MVVILLVIFGKQKQNLPQINVAIELLSCLDFREFFVYYSKVWAQKLNE